MHKFRGLYKQKFQNGGGAAWVKVEAQTGDLKAKPQAAGGRGVWDLGPKRSEIFKFCYQNNSIFRPFLDIIII